MATFSDDFNRADGGLGANYDHVNTGLTVISNQARGTNNGLLCYSAVKTSVADFTDDHEAQLTISTAAVNDYCGPMVRSAGTTANGYYLYADNNGATSRSLYKAVSGTRTKIGSVAIAATSGDVLKLRAVGSTLTWYKNGTLMETLTSQTDHTTGQPGLVYDWSNNGATRLDTFQADDVSASSSIAAISSGFHVRNINR